MPPPDPLAEAVRSGSVPGDGPSLPLALGRELARLGGDQVVGVVFFGSRKTEASPDAWSAHDFFLVTRGYLGFYRALAAAGKSRRGPRLLAVLNAILPPNQIAVRAEVEGAPWLAKCAVISLATLIRETSRGRRDHFCAGRLFQPAEIVFAAGAAVREQLVAALRGAHALTYAWVRPWLPETFDVPEYCRTTLRVSLAGEIRPEPAERAEALWEAQRATLEARYAVLLRQLAEQEELEALGNGRYRLRRRAGFAERLRLAAYFRWSLVRATARWLKHVVTFDDWLDYIVRKARRHSGREIVLTARERRLPLVFLWPRLIRYLRQKDGSGKRA